MREESWKTCVRHRLQSNLWDIYSGLRKSWTTFLSFRSEWESAAVPQIQKQVMEICLCVLSSHDPHSWRPLFCFYLLCSNCQSRFTASCAVMPWGFLFVSLFITWRLVSYCLILQNSTDRQPEILGSLSPVTEARAAIRPMIRVLSAANKVDAAAAKEVLLRLSASIVDIDQNVAELQEGDEWRKDLRWVVKEWTRKGVNWTIGEYPLVVARYVAFSSKPPLMCQLSSPDKVGGIWCTYVPVWESLNWCRWDT